MSTNLTQYSDFMMDLNYCKNNFHIFSISETP